MNTAATERTKYMQRASINGVKKFSESTNSGRTDLSFQKITIDNLGSYQGQVLKDTNIPNGKGKLVLDNGVVYNGDFKNGKMSGFGVMEDFEGNYYEGEFKRGTKHGKGFEILEGGEETGKVCYEGKFKNDIKEGYGKQGYVILQENSIKRRSGFTMATFPKGNSTGTASSNGRMESLTKVSG